VGRQVNECPFKGTACGIRFEIGQRRHDERVLLLESKGAVGEEPPEFDRFPE